MIPLLTAKFHSRLFLALCILGLVSCADSPAKLLDDHIAAIEEVTEILEKVADGSLSSADAASKIAKLDSKFEALKARADKQKEAAKDFKPNKAQEEEVRKAMNGMIAAMGKVHESGRATKELTNAIESMGGKGP